MRNKILTILMKDSRGSNYSQSEIDNAMQQIMDFINQLEKCSINENGIERKLSQLEEMIFIYDFVANRKYIEDHNHAHSIIGALNKGYSVCEGFSKIAELICELRGIPFLYKHVNTNEGSVDHGNFQVIVTDKNGIQHCVHCDPTIDCLFPPTNDPNDSFPNGKEHLTYNAFLIDAKKVKDYYRGQEPSGGQGETEIFWKIAVNGITSEQLKSNCESVSNMDIFWAEMQGKTSQDVIKNRYMECSEYLSSLGDFLEIEVGEHSTNEQIISEYKRLYDRYNELNNPIDREELFETIRNVYKQNLPLSFARSDIEQRISETKENDKKFWNSKESEKYSVVDVSDLGQQVIQEMSDPIIEDETERQEKIDISKMEGEVTRES